MKIYRQGDLIFTPIESLPEGKIQTSKEHTLALGEATGHHHTMVCDQDIDLVEMDGEKCFVLKAKAILTHQEHKTIEFAPGIYKMRIEQERDPFLQAIRKVQD